VHIGSTWLSFGLSGALLFGALDANANGRFPTAQQLAPSPTDPTLLGMMATFGVVLSEDQGASWNWICEMAVGYQSNENPVLGITSTNSILVGAFEGLGITTDRGCTWSFSSSGIRDPVIDLVVEPSNTHTALILSSGYLGQDDAGSTFTSRVWITKDDGATFSQVGGNLDPDILPETIEVAPSDATRVYASGTRRIGGVPYGVLLASTNSGQSFTETDFALLETDAGPTDRAPYIAGVDPTNPNRVYVRVDNIDGSRLLVSDDGLATTRQVWQAQGDLLGFVVSPDGTKVYAGGPNDGLHVASSTALDFSNQTWPGQVQCLTFYGSQLLACSNEVSGFVVGSSTDDGATWTAVLHLSCVAGPLACPATSLETTQCAPNWPTQLATLGGPDPSCSGDGGVEAGADSGSGAPPPQTTPSASKSKGGCSLSSPGLDVAAPRVAIALAGVSLAAFVARRRRRRPARGDVNRDPGAPG
jgi:hypothetical protein